MVQRVQRRLLLIITLTVLWLGAWRADAALPPSAACCTATVPASGVADVRVGVFCLDFNHTFPRTTALTSLSTEANSSESLPIEQCVVEPGYLRWALLYSMEQGDVEVDHWPVQLASWFLIEISQGKHTVADINKDNAWHFDSATTAAQKARARTIAQYGWDQFQTAGEPPACDSSGGSLCTAFTAGDIGLSFSQLVPFDPSPHGSEPFRGIGTLRLTNNRTTAQQIQIPYGIGLPTGSNNQKLLTYPLGSLRVTKFRDRNSNGVRDSDEPWDGPAVQINLDAPAGHVDTRNTDSNGQVLWSELAPAEYTVSETVPAGYCATTPASFQALVQANKTTEVAFGNRGGDLEVFKFDDRNGNGVQDQNEPPLAGVTITATFPDGHKESRQTDSSGFARWTDVPGGSYTVTVTLPAGTRSTTPTTQSVTVTPCQTARITFGCQALGSLLIHKFYDRNRNGVEDADEGWIGPPVSFQVSGPSLNNSAQTNQYGDLRWNSLAPGNYTITEAVPTGACTTGSNPRTVAVAAGQEARAAFGNAWGRIEVFTFNDANRNGTRDEADTAFDGIPLTLRFPDSHTESRMSDGNGIVRWDDLPSGQYTVEANFPAGYTATGATSRTIDLQPCQQKVVSFGAYYFLTHPKGMAVNEATDRLYVAYRGPEKDGDYPDPALAIVDANPLNPTFHRILNVVKSGIGTHPVGVAVNPDTNVVYVASFGDGFVTALNATTGAVLAQIDPSGSSDNARPLWVAINRTLKHIYVANYGTDTVAVIDGNPASPTFNQVLREIFDEFAAPWYVAADPYGSVYVGDREKQPFRIRAYRDSGSDFTMVGDILLDGAANHPPVGSPYVIALKPTLGQYRLYFTIAVDPARANPDRVITVNIASDAGGGTVNPASYSKLAETATGPLSEGGIFYNGLTNHVYVTEGGAADEFNCNEPRGSLHTLAVDGSHLSEVTTASAAIEHGAGSYTMWNPFAVTANTSTGYVYVGDRCLDEVLVLRDGLGTDPTPTPGPTQTPTATPGAAWP
ncbi:MAG TPA: hypothetical protein DEP84_31970, partial [Chloroflexi bacterium]|nr:hypothetical protein [Chloroflexota bacterium]